MYAARIAAVASFVMLNTLAEVEGAFDATLGARDCGSSRRGGNEPCIDGDAGGDAAAGCRTGEKVGDGSDDSQLSYWLGVEEEEEVLGATLDIRWWWWYTIGYDSSSGCRKDSGRVGGKAVRKSLGACEGQVNGVSSASCDSSFD